jgi:MinD superfamily P-loop ATPase
VHASPGGVDALVALTEPSGAGEHDLERLLRLAARFGLPAGVVINRFDLVLEAVEPIESASIKRQRLPQSQPPAPLRHTAPTAQSAHRRRAASSNQPGTNPTSWRRARLLPL